MTDAPDAPRPAPGPDDDRDPALAAALAVAPLAETTRRSLVRTAVAAASPRSEAPARTRRFGAVVGVAAALLVGAVVGAVVVTRPPEPDTPSAARASSTAPTTAAAELASPAPESVEDEVSAVEPSGQPPQDLGDLGTVRGASQLRAAIAGGFERGDTGGARRDALPCADRDAGLLGLVVVSAVAEAQLDGLPVIVLVGPTPTGETEAFALDPARGCELVERFPL